MENLWAIGTVMLIALVGIMSPGPDFIAVSYTAITGSRRNAIPVALGVVLGNGLWAGAALLGVGALFALFPSLFWVIKTLGALYFVWLGVKLLRSARKPLPEHRGESVAGSLPGLFMQGFSTTLSNPKAAIYYASALSTAAPASADWWLLSAMILTVIGTAGLWFACVILLFSNRTAAAVFRRFKAVFESIFGGILIFFGLRQLFAR